MKLSLFHKIIIAVSAAILIFCSGFWIGYSNSKTTINVNSTVNSPENKNSVNSENSDIALININTADAEELQLLPGIGPALSSAIIEYRSTNGKFESIDEIMNVSGISLVVFRSIESLITV